MQSLGGPGELAEVLVADLARADLLGGHLRLLGQDAGDELLGRHFEAEKGDRRAGRLGRLDAVALVRRKRSAAANAMLVASAVLPMPGRPATMIRSDRWSPPIRELRRSKPVVMPDSPPPLLSAARHCGSSPSPLRRRTCPALGAALLGDLVQLGLGALDLSEGGNVLTRVERAFDQVAADANQRPEQRQIVDLLREVPRADHGSARSR